MNRTDESSNSVDDPEKAEKSAYTLAPPSPLGSAHNLSI
jgi:hypothetical protein